MTITKEIIDLIENHNKIKNILRNTISELKYHLFWSKEDKKKSEELIKKYQLPKGTFGIKEVIVSKDIKRIRRTEE